MAVDKWATPPIPPTLDLTDGNERYSCFRAGLHTAHRAPVSPISGCCIRLTSYWSQGRSRLCSTGTVLVGLHAIEHRPGRGFCLGPRPAQSSQRQMNLGRQADGRGNIPLRGEQTISSVCPRTQHTCNGLISLSCTTCATCALSCEASQTDRIKSRV